MQKNKIYTFCKCKQKPELGWKILLQGWVFTGTCTCGESINYKSKHIIETKQIDGPYQWSDNWITALY